MISYKISDHSCLIGMVIESYLISETVRGILAIPVEFTQEPLREVAPIRLNSEPL